MPAQKKKNRSTPGNPVSTKLSLRYNAGAWRSRLKREREKWGLGGWVAGWRGGPEGEEGGDLNKKEEHKEERGNILSLLSFPFCLEFGWSIMKKLERKVRMYVYI